MIRAIKKYSNGLTIYFILCSIIYIDPTDDSEGTKNSKLNVNVNNILKTPTGIRFILWY